MATEDTPIMSTGVPSIPMLVLAPHAQAGRQASIGVSLVLMVGFNVTLVITAYLNWGVPCDQPLNVFLLAFGLIGLLGSAVYVAIELGRSGSPTVIPKLLILALLIGGAAVGTSGLMLMGSSPGCHLSSPIVYNWTLAAVLAFCIFTALVLSVPLLSLLFPFAPLVINPVIATLALASAWMQEAGKRGTFGAAGAIQRLLRSGDTTEQEPALSSPVSHFALYVNTTALIWFFAYLIVEVRRSWYLPCDAPLHAFLAVLGVAGIALSVAQFLGAVFHDPMPPMTKAEQSHDRESRLRRLAFLKQLAVGLCIWGSLGTFWVQFYSRSCSHTAPQLYQLSRLFSMTFSALAAVAALALVVVGIDYCCSGKLRMIVVFES